MDNQLKQFIGSWIQAIGTVIAAIGSTPSNILDEEFRNDLSLWGNVLQGMGNSLVADGIETVSLEKLGNEVQAIGNTTVVAGMLIDFKEETKQSLIIKGNLMQAVGGGMAVADEIDEEPSLEKALNVISNLLQVIGNSMQALGGIYELENNGGQVRNKHKGEQSNQTKNYQFYNSRDNSQDKDKEDKYGESLDVSGSWIQAVGSVIGALVETQEVIGKESSTIGNL